jgi:hypothetical protein
MMMKGQIERLGGRAAVGLAKTVASLYGMAV